MKKPKIDESLRKLAELRVAVHEFFNVTTNPPEIERRLRELIYGKPLSQ